LIADIVALELRRGQSSQLLSWPRNADAVVLGSFAKSACWHLASAPSEGHSPRLVPYSHLHSLSMFAARVASWLAGRSARERALAMGVAAVFSNPELSGDFENLVLVGANRHGMRDTLCICASDTRFLPRPYCVALVLIKAIEDGRIVAKAVPLLEGFRHVTDSPALEAYKHPNGECYEMMAAGQPKAVRDRVELSLGQEKFTVRPVYER
jgi:hypothetical protein